MDSNFSQTNEIFIGIVKPAGIKTESLVDRFKTKLKEFAYKVEVIDISNDIIIPLMILNGKEIKKNAKRDFNYIQDLMDFGNALRSDYQNDIIARLVAVEISKRREEKYNDFNERIAYLITSLKNPDEVSFLRDLYSKAFTMVGILQSKEIRTSYLTGELAYSEEEVNRLFDRDTNELFEYGQKFRDTFYLSDFFVNYYNGDALSNQLDRFFNLLFGNPYITPTFNEFAMYSAFSASLRSADLARQVGAVITKNNEIIAQGANDCPKFKGGLYWPKIIDDYKYKDEDNGRDYMIGYDSNKKEIFNIYEDILECLEIKKDDDMYDEYINKLKHTKIKSLTEFGRSVHAEMEAISMCARNMITSKNATLYCTTFPCHNCTKHIVASGIVKVIYIEPYPKSKALELYEDSIKINENLIIELDDNKVIFEPFIGVAPRLFYDLFSMNYSSGYEIKRKDKENGHIIKCDKKTKIKAKYRFRTEPYGYLDKEKYIKDRIHKEEE